MKGCKKITLLYAWQGTKTNLRALLTDVNYHIIMCDVTSREAIKLYCFPSQKVIIFVIARYSRIHFTAFNPIKSGGGGGGGGHFCPRQI